MYLQRGRETSADTGGTTRSLLVKAVGTVDEDITDLATKLDQLDLEINDENMIRAEHKQPFELSEIECRSSSKLLNFEPVII